MSEFAAEPPSREQFLKAVDTQFEARTPAGEPFELTLTALQTHVDNDVQENFSLVFTASDAAQAAQDTFYLKHESLGEFVLFLVPVGRDAKGTHFEAVFNLLKR